MKTVLYIGPDGFEYWRKYQGLWQTQTAPTQGAVWAVTDLAEESLVEIQVPRLFGRDHANFVARQLASRFPDTPFRVSMPLRTKGSLLDRLSPPRRLLAGVDAAQRIQAALAAQTAPLAGVWCSSLLLAMLARNKKLPAELFVVMPGQRSLRIVFLKNRQPVLARMVPASEQAAQQAAEIVRTLRHLENTRSVERSEHRYPVLLLGSTVGLGVALAAQGLDLIAAPARWRHRAPADWRFVLFDLALDSPCGQLAPLAARSAFLGRLLRRTTYGTSAICLCATLWFASDQFQGALAAQRERTQVQSEIARVEHELTHIETRIGRFGVNPTLLRQVVNLDEQELLFAPALSDSMRVVANLVGRDSRQHVSRFQWRLLSDTPSACAQTGAINAGQAAPELSGARNVRRSAELSFDLVFAIDTSAREREHVLTDISHALSGLPGTALLQDPAQGFAHEVLTSADHGDAARRASWCLSLSNTGVSSPHTASVAP